MSKSEEGQDEMTSLARFILDIVAQLRNKIGENAVDPTLANLSIKEITFSVPYDPGPDSLPLRLPSPRDGVPVMPWPQARSYLLAGDRKVALDRTRLVETPLKCIARLELKIRLTEE